MGYSILARDEHLENNGAPKRILTLDGGGLRGIYSIGILQEMENLLRERHGGGDDFRLAHYFDLIAGTSTGAIIAAALALGWKVEDLRKKYMELGHAVFRKSLLRRGYVRARYDHRRLTEELKAVYGEDTTLGDAALQTGLLIVTKRLDTGSPWPISNNPKGRYFKSRKGGVLGNGSYLLWQVVRASTAAPTFFCPEPVVIGDGRSGERIVGSFVDGGVSPFNNPALQAFMYATLAGYRLEWPAGKDRILLVSVGTGTRDPSVKPNRLAGLLGRDSLISLMDDAASLQEVMLQWLSDSPTARHIDRELGALQGDLLGGAPMLHYLRYNVNLTRESVRQLKPEVPDERISSLNEMDAPGNMEVLYELGVETARRDLRASHFPAHFDLPEPPLPLGNRKRYRKRADQRVVAVRLDLETEGFCYRKWGGEQCCKAGDWLVCNNGDTYTVDADVFATTYRQVAPGQYVKVAPVWAEVATTSGSIHTREGESRYRAGDYLVYDRQEGGEGYCMSAERFVSMYEPDEEPSRD